MICGHTAETSCNTSVYRFTRVVYNSMMRKMGANTAKMGANTAKMGANTAKMGGGGGGGAV